jgi:alpha-beta hydrolase superfamily lysophospholipase
VAAERFAADSQPGGIYADVRFTEVSTGASGNLPGWLALPETSQARVACVFVHGLGEHAGRYRELAQALARVGVASLAFDLPGHGLSPGRRGAPPSYDAMLDDIDHARQTLKSHLPSIPQVLLGHSMGGNLAINYSLRWPHDLAGIILAAPMMLPANPPKRDQIFAAWLTGKLLPFIRFRTNVLPDQLTHDPEQIERLANDPLMHNQMSLRLGTQLLAQGRWSLDQASKLQLPLLVLHGEQDTLTESQASHALCIRVGEQAEFFSFPEMYHGLLYERERADVFARIITWLTARWGPPAGS